MKEENFPKSSTPLVSIMIPTYNQSKYISESIESALAQDYENLEIIIADDCSSDATGDIVEAYKGNPRIRYIRREKNLGRVGNYHETLYKDCKGEWVINLDGDDYFCSTKFISWAMNMVQDHPNVVMACGRVEKVFTGWSNLSANQNIPLCINGIDAVTNKYKQFQPFHAGTLYKRDLALRVGFYENDIISSDRESLLKLCFHGNILTTGETVAVWRNTGGNISTQKDINLEKNNIQFYDNVLRYGMNNHFLTDDEAKWLSFHYYFSIAKECYLILRNEHDIKKYFTMMLEIYRHNRASAFKAMRKPKVSLKILAILLRVAK